MQEPQDSTDDSWVVNAEIKPVDHIRTSYASVSKMLGNYIVDGNELTGNSFVLKRNASDEIYDCVKKRLKPRLTSNQPKETSESIRAKQKARRVVKRRKAKKMAKASKKRNRR